MTRALLRTLWLPAGPVACDTFLFLVSSWSTLMPISRLIRCLISALQCTMRWGLVTIKHPIQHYRLMSRGVERGLHNVSLVYSISPPCRISLLPVYHSRLLHLGLCSSFSKWSYEVVFRGLKEKLRNFFSISIAIGRKHALPKCYDVVRGCYELAVSVVLWCQYVDSRSDPLTWKRLRCSSRPFEQ